MSGVAGMSVFEGEEAEGALRIGHEEAMRRQVEKQKDSFVEGLLQRRKAIVEPIFGGSSGVWILAVEPEGFGGGAGAVVYIVRLSI
jgi:hypothetical protein